MSWTSTVWAPASMMEGKRVPYPLCAGVYSLCYRLSNSPAAKSYTHADLPPRLVLITPKIPGKYPENASPVSGVRSWSGGIFPSRAVRRILDESNDLSGDSPQERTYR